MTEWWSGIRPPPPPPPWELGSTNFCILIPSNSLLRDFTVRASFSNFFEGDLFNQTCRIAKNELRSQSLHTECANHSCIMTQRWENNPVINHVSFIRRFAAHAHIHRYGDGLCLPKRFPKLCSSRGSGGIFLLDLQLYRADRPHPRLHYVHRHQVKDEWKTKSLRGKPSLCAACLICFLYRGYSRCQCEIAVLHTQLEYLLNVRFAVHVLGDFHAAYMKPRLRLCSANTPLSWQY